MDEKWASQVINELFESDSNVKDSQNINKKSNGHELPCLQKDFDASELKSSKYYNPVKVLECNSTLSALHNDLDTDGKFPRSPSDVQCDSDLSIHNNPSLFISCVSTDPDSFSNSHIETSDQGLESLLSDASKPVLVYDSEDITIILDLIRDMISMTETSLDESNVNVLQTDALKSDPCKVVHSEPLKTNDFEIDSLLEKIEDTGEEGNSVLKELNNLKLGEEDSLDFRTTDKEISNTLECNGCDGEINTSETEKYETFQSLKNMYLDRLKLCTVDHFIKEEMEYRWERYTNPPVMRKYYQNNQKPKAEVVGDRFQHVKSPKKSSIKRQKSAPEIESVAEVITSEQPPPRKVKGKSTKRVTFSDTCKESTEKTSFEAFSNDSFENSSSGNAIERNSKQSILDENNNAENVRRNSFIRIQDSQQEQNTSLYNIDDDDDDEIVFQRAARVITGYRSICTTIERFFVSPFALVIAECIDLIIFVFIMILCLFYLFCENVVDKALNSSNKFELSFDKIFRKQKRVIERGDDESLNQINSEVTITEEFSEKDASSEFSSFVVDEDIDKNAADLNNVSFIDPTDVLKIVSPMAKVTNFNFEKKYEKMDNFMETLTIEHQTAVITSNENILVDAIFKDKFIENCFDTEIIASSRTLGYKLFESRDSSPFKTFKRTHSSEKISKENGSDECAPIMHMKNLENSLYTFKPIVLRQEEYILNSTELEDSNLIAESTPRSSSNFNSLCPTNVNFSSADEVQSPLNDTLVSSSSLNVNLPSFCSRSDEDILNNSRSMSSLVNEPYETTLDSIIDTNNNEREKNVEANGDEESSVVNLISTGSEDIGNVQIGDNKRDSFGVKNKTFFEKISPRSFKIKSPKKLTTMCQQELECNNDFYASNIVVDDQHNSYEQFENTDEASEIAIKPSNCNSSSEFDSLMEPSALPCERKHLRRKSSGNLRQRMSSIYNNLKTMQMMQCVSSVNTKSKGYPSMKIIKKYKKHFEKP